MLDELLLGGEVQETSKKNVLKAIAAQDLLQEVGHVKVRLKVRTRSQLKISVSPHLTHNSVPGIFSKREGSAFLLCTAND